MSDYSTSLIAECRAEAIRLLTAKHGEQEFPPETIGALAIALYANGWPVI